MFKHDFDYVGMDYRGQVARDTVRAANEREALETISRLGYTVKSMLARPSGFSETAFYLALVCSFILGSLGYQTIKPLWHFRDTTRKLATQGTQIQATVVSKHPIEGRPRKSSMGTSQWLQYRYQFIAPDGQAYSGMLTENSEDFSISRAVFPIAWLNPRPEVGDTFIVTWHGGPETLFVPGTFDLRNYQGTHRRFLQALAGLLIIQIVIWGAFVSYSRMGFVSRMFRPVTQSRSQPHVLFLRSQVFGVKWAGFLFLILALFLGTFVLVEQRRGPTWDISGLTILALSSAFIAACAWLSPGWAKLDRQSDRLTIKPGVPIGHPFQSRVTCSLTMFREVVLSTERNERKVRRGRTIQFIARVHLPHKGDTSIFGCEVNGYPLNKLWYDGLEEKARELGEDVARRVAWFLDVPARDNYGPLPPAIFFPESANSQPDRRTSR